MADPLTLGIASTAVGLVNGTISLLKQAREAAKSSEDHDLKDKLNEIYDTFLELKELIVSLREENSDLKRRFAEKASVTRNNVSGFYYESGDTDPLCPICWEKDERKVHLRPPITKTSGIAVRKCLVCKHELRDLKGIG